MSARGLGALLRTARELGIEKLCVTPVDGEGFTAELNTDHTVLLQARIYGWPLDRPAVIDTAVRIRPRKTPVPIKVEGTTVYIDGYPAGELVERCEHKYTVEEIEPGRLYKLENIMFKVYGEAKPYVLRAFAESAELIGFAYTINGDPLLVAKTGLPGLDGWRAWSPDDVKDMWMEKGAETGWFTVTRSSSVKPLAARATGDIRFSFTDNGPLLFTASMYDVDVALAVAPVSPTAYPEVERYRDMAVEGRLPSYVIRPAYACYDDGEVAWRIVDSASKHAFTDVYMAGNIIYMLHTTMSAAAAVQAECAGEPPPIGGTAYVESPPLIRALKLARLWGYTESMSSPFFFDAEGRPGDGFFEAILLDKIVGASRAVARASLDWRRVCAAAREAWRRGSTSFRIENGEVIVGGRSVGRIQFTGSLESELVGLVFACDTISPTELSIIVDPCGAYKVLVRGRRGWVLVSTNAEPRESPPTLVSDLFGSAYARADSDMARIAHAYAVLYAGARPDMEELERIREFWEEAKSRAREAMLRLAGKCGEIEASTVYDAASLILAAINDIKSRAPTTTREEAVARLRRQLDELAAKADELRKRIEETRTILYEYVGRGCMVMDKMEETLKRYGPEADRLAREARSLADKLRELASKLRELGAEADASRAEELAGELEDSVARMYEVKRMLEDDYRKCMDALRKAVADAERELAEAEKLIAEAEKARYREEIDELLDKASKLSEELRGKISRLRGFPEARTGELIKRLSRTRMELLRAVRDLELRLPKAPPKPAAVPRELLELAEDAAREAEALAKTYRELRSRWEELRAERERLLGELSEAKLPPEQLEPRVREFISKALDLAAKARDWLAEHSRYTEKLSRLEREAPELLLKIPAQLRDELARARTIVEEQILRDAEYWAKNMEERLREYARRVRAPPPPPPKPAAVRPPAAPAPPPPAPPPTRVPEEQARLAIEYYLRSRVKRIYRVDWRRGLRARISVHSAELEALRKAIEELGGRIENIVRARPPLVIVYADFSRARIPSIPMPAPAADIILRDKFYSILAAVGLDPTRYEELISRLIAETEGAPWQERQRRVVDEARRIVEEYERLWEQFATTLREAGVNPWQHREQFLKLFYETEGMPMEERERRIRLLAHEIAPPPPPPAPPPVAPAVPRELIERIERLERLVEEAVRAIRTVQERVPAPVTPELYTASFQDIISKIDVRMGVDAKGRPACQPAGTGTQIINTVVPWKPVRELFYSNPETRDELGFTRDILVIASDIIGKYWECGRENPMMRAWLEAFTVLLIRLIACERTAYPQPYHEEIDENPASPKCKHPICKTIVRCGLDEVWREAWRTYMR